MRVCVREGAARPGAAARSPNRAESQTTYRSNEGANEKVIFTNFSCAAAVLRDCERRLRHYRQHLQGLAMRTPPRRREGGRKTGSDQTPRRERRRIYGSADVAPFRERRCGHAPARAAFAAGSFLRSESMKPFLVAKSLISVSRAALNS